MKAGLCLLGTLTLCAELPDEPADLLARARARLVEAARRAPRYTCTETIQRSYFRRLRRRAPGTGCDQIIADKLRGIAKLELTATDRLRLQVAIADSGREIFSWASAARIETDRVADLVGGGPFGTGSFGPFLLDIFDNRGVEFSYRGKRAGPIEYRFRVPLASSHYQVHGGRGPRFFPYDGSFWLDPDSAELKRLRVRTTELPYDTGTCEATTTVDFDRVRLGTGEYLLPRESRLEFIARNGDEWANVTSFSACREYSGESTLHFEETAPPQPSLDEAPGVGPAPVPPGLRVLLSLQTEIDTDTAAAGDPVAAMVLKDILDPRSRQLVAPARARAHGRIIKMEHAIAPPAAFLISIAFDTLEFGGIARPFAAQLKSSLTIRWGGPPKGYVLSRTKFPRVGTFVFRSREPRYVVPRGFESEWVTLASMPH